MTWRRAAGATGDELLDYERYRWVHRRIARSTDSRTLISTIAPRRVLTEMNSTTIKVRETGISNRRMLAWCALANSLVVDYLLRMRVNSVLTMFYLYQLPVPELGERDTHFAYLADRAAKLIAVAQTFGDLWREAMGAEWTPESGATAPAERARLRAEIDGLVAHLYGLTEEEFVHVLSTFPLVGQSVKDAALAEYRRLAPKTADPELRLLLLGGEGPRVEFKSTARWDLRQAQRNAALESVVLKTVAGFLNSRDGGTLLLGVADDGKAVGLEHDYSTLQKKDRDGFGLFLSDLLFGAFGKDLAPFVEWHFHSLEERDVCRVEVRASRKLVHFRDGNEDALWVRVGNSTRKFSAKEAIDYERQRSAQQASLSAPPPLDASAPAPPKHDPVVASAALAESPLFKNSAPRPLERPAALVPVEEAEVEDILVEIRDLLESREAKEGLEREDALRRLRERLGYERLGSRMKELLSSHLVTAARRRIVVTEGGLLFLATKSIEDYSHEEIKLQLLAALGPGWRERDEAARALARRLGFRRAGTRIRQAVRSAINGCLRQGWLEKDGSRIRKARS